MQEKNRKNRKKKVALISALLALFAILAGTFAWTSYTEWVKNHMQSKGFEDGGISIVEVFKGGTDPIVPGANIQKEVDVVNATSVDAFIRLSFEEMLNTLDPAGASNAQAYGNTTDAGFPVIFNDSEYRSGSNYTETAFTIKVTEGGAVVPVGNVTGAGETLKLYVKNDLSSATLVLEKEMNVSDFPDDFEFAFNGTDLPVISGDFTAGSGDATVAQKVTGYVKQTATGWEVYTNNPALTADQQLGFWGYGSNVGTAMEANWAGEAVFVNTGATYARGTVGATTATSTLDSALIINLEGVTLTKPTAGNTPLADWYYNDADGYFYYTRVLDKSSTTMTSLTESIQFPNTPRYNLAVYNLYVGMEAIPAAVAPLTAPSLGGAFSTGTIPTPDADGKYKETNDAGWELTDADLIAFYSGIATVTNP